MLLPAYLEDILSQGKCRVDVQQPAEEDLHAHHVGWREREILLVGPQLISNEQGRGKGKQKEPNPVAEGVILFLETYGLVSLQYLEFVSASKHL